MFACVYVYVCVCMCVSVCVCDCVCVCVFYMRVVTKTLKTIMALRHAYVPIQYRF